MANRVVKMVTLASASVIAMAAFISPAAADPIITPIITGLIISNLPSVAVALGISGTLALAGIVSSVITTAISFGLTYLGAQIFAPKQRQPAPEDRQSLIRESTHSRFRSYGLVKTSGLLAYAAVNNGSLFRVIALGHGRINRILEHWIDDKKVEINPTTGWVTTAPYTDKIRIRFRLGDKLQTAYPELISAIPEDWTDDHRGNGMPHVLIELAPISPAEAAELYPRGEPNYQCVMESALVFDPRDPTQTRDNEATWKYSSNAALVLMDYLTYQDGMGLPWSVVGPSIEQWKEAANACDELAPKFGGGTVRRYQICNSYDFYGERRADVLSRYLQACDGQLHQGPDGSLGLTVGKWVEPTVVIGDDAVTDYEAARGDNITTAVNVIVSRFASAEHNFVSIDAPDWRDEEDIAARGELSAPLDFLSSPNQNQTRRLMKLAARRAKRNWSLTVTCNMLGLAVVGHRFIRLKLDEIEIDETFEIVGDPEFLLDENMVLRGIRFSVGSISADAFDFDAATEEGETRVPPEITSDEGVPAMAGLTATIIRETVTGGQTVAYAEFTWTAAPNASLTPGLRMKKISEDATKWVPISIAQNATKARSNVLEDGVQYEVQGRFIGATGLNGAWSSSVNFTGVANVTAPAQLSAVTLSTAADTVTVGYTTPNDINYVKSRIYRSQTNNSATATFVQDIFSPRNSVSGNVISVVSDGAYGTWFYWAASSNGSNIDAGRQTPTPASVLVKSANLIVNGDFASGSNWTPGTDWSIASGFATKIPGAAAASVTQAMTLVAGASYEITFTVLSRTVGTVQPRFTGGTTVSGTARSANGTFTETLVAASGNTTFALLGSSNANLSVDDVSIIRIG